MIAVTNMMLERIAKELKRFNDREDEKLKQQNAPYIEEEAQPYRTPSFSEVECHTCGRTRPKGTMCNKCTGRGLR